MVASWAIQAKAYDTAYWIKKADVGSFLSESSPAVLLSPADRNDGPAGSDGSRHA
jgi:hypothetical protein